jgi:hypothetical protein
MQIEVFSLIDDTGRIRSLGTAASFGEARDMQKASLPDDLKDAYAGIDGGLPLFYAEFLTPALKEKYPQLADRIDEDG